MTYKELLDKYVKNEKLYNILSKYAAENGININSVAGHHSLAKYIHEVVVPYSGSVSDSVKRGEFPLWRDLAQYLFYLGVRRQPFIIYEWKTINQWTEEINNRAMDEVNELVSTKYPPHSSLPLFTGYTLHSISPRNEFFSY